MISASASLSGLAAASPSGPRDNEALKDAARGVEAMFLRQVLSAARATSFADDDNPLSGGSAADTFAEMRDAKFADIASQTDMIGLAATLAKQLSRTTRQGG